jgi:hypothetical protein
VACKAHCELDDVLFDLPSEFIELCEPRALRQIVVDVQRWELGLCVGRSVGFLGLVGWHGLQSRADFAMDLNGRLKLVPEISSFLRVPLDALTEVVLVPAAAPEAESDSSTPGPLRGLCLCLNESYHTLLRVRLIVEFVLWLHFQSGCNKFKLQSSDQTTGYSR